MYSSNKEQKWAEAITGTYLSRYLRHQNGHKLSYKTLDEAKTQAIRAGDARGGITLEKGGQSGLKYTLRKGNVAHIDYHKNQTTYGLASWIKI